MHQFYKNGIRYLRHKLARGALILIYHRINESRLDPWSISVSPGHFEEHLDVLRRSFHPKRLRDVARSIRGDTKLADRSIVITFDDGYADNLHRALPLLEQYDIPATIFIATGAIGSQREFWWDELATLLLTAQSLPDRLDIIINGKSCSWEVGESSLDVDTQISSHPDWKVGQPPPSSRHAIYLELWQLINGLSMEEQQKVMSALRDWASNTSYTPTHRTLDENEIVRLAQSEQIEIGAHTINHLSLASLSCEAQRDEIAGSKEQLENILNRPVTSFSYPFGKQQNYQPQTVGLVQEAGFSVACCNESGVVTANTDPFQLPRIHVPDCDGDAFEARLLSKFYV